ncbi:MAG: NAD-dependent epimerase/dehydratase family protein [Myxococcota bacterium]|nr:NAD-dependent epimerase/dehydratase family protein [Myxococcota bacterium]
MRVLVTGAAGFIGQHVVRMLEERGDSVRALLAPGESPGPLAGRSCEIVSVDIRDLPGLVLATEGCDAVIHLAAIYALWMKDYRVMYQVNVQGTRNVLEAARLKKVDRVVYTSSIAAVGVEDGVLAATEDTKFNQHGQASHYVLSKYYAERVAFRYAAEGLPVTIVNPACPFGEGDHRPTPTGRTICRIVVGSYFAHGPGGLNVVDVEDVARGHILALERGQVGRRYLLSGTDISYRQFFDQVKAIAGVERRSFGLPYAPMALLGLGGDLVGRFREPLIDSVTVRYTSQFLYFNCRRARQELGYEVTPLDTVLRKAIDWFDSVGYFSKDAPWRLKVF